MHDAAFFFSQTSAWTTASITLTGYETETERQQLCLQLSSEWLAVSKDEKELKNTDYHVKNEDVD